MIPSTYVVIDTETNDFNNPFVLQLGYCRVENSEVIATESINIRPPAGVVISDGAANIHGLTLEVLEKSGSDPVESMTMLREHLVELNDKGTWFIGQNYTFDTAAINSTLRTLNLEPIKFDSFNIIDVGVVFKAHRLMKEWRWGARAQRRKDVPLMDFFDYIRAQRIRGLKWGIDFCMEFFAIKAPARGAHDAGEDCWLTHMIFQEMVKRGIVAEVLYANQ